MLTYRYLENWISSDVQKDSCPGINGEWFMSKLKESEITWMIYLDMLDIACVENVINK